MGWVDEHGSHFMWKLGAIAISTNCGLYTNAKLWNASEARKGYILHMGS
tara:strand:- start:28 stop:174 length:147 start_codon:yes stop_codon:yes gene_type:complete